eukprot:gene1762-3409_t
MKTKTKANTNNKKKAENPFDKFANPKKKHEILNRKVKGENRNVGRARAKAIDDRKNKLLRDYKSSKKNNSFTDRRFGEDDADLSLEEKMFMRFQKEKLKKSRNASLFNLESDETNILTHKGKLLSDDNMVENDWPSDDDDGLDRNIVNALHFGGGLVQKENDQTDSSSFHQPNRTRAEMLQDVIMKSKLRKLEKKEAKDAQEQSTELLDSAFESLVSESLLKFNPLRRDRSERDEGETATTPFGEYDVSLRAMAFEARVQATDRTKSPEEIALAAREKLEELEAARLRRMKKGTVNGSQEEEEEVKNALKDNNDSKKRKKSTITDDDVEQSSHYGGEDDEEDDDEDDNDDYDEEDEEDGEEGDEDDDDEDEDDWEEEEDIEGGDEDDEDGVIEKSSSGPSSKDTKLQKMGNETSNKTTNIISLTNNVTTDPSQENNSRGKKKTVTEAVKISSLPLVNESMPHNIECPADVTEFYEVIEKYVTNANDLQAFLERIITWNSIHLPGTTGVENRTRLHNFLDMLLRYFIKVGDKLSVCTKEELQADTMKQLDTLSLIMFRLTRDLTTDVTSCALLWGRLLKSLHVQLMKRLRDYVQEERAASCWPSLGTLLLMKSMSHVFSISDHRHAVIGPATLLLCQCLSQCPVRTKKDLACGLLVCSIVIEYTGETDPVGIVPEVFTFVAAALSLLAPPFNSTSANSTVGNGAIRHPPLCTVDYKLAEGLRSGSHDTTDMNEETPLNKISWTHFSEGGRGKNEQSLGPGVLSTCHALCKRLYERHGDSIAAPELFDPIISTLRLVRPHVSPAFPKKIQENHASLLQDMTSSLDKIASSRQPLQWRMKVTKAIDSLTPRYQMDYAPTKDMDPDRGRVEAKQLTRQLKREKKAAMRELTRDADFLDQEKYKEQLEAINKRKAERAKNFVWMEEQQATLKQQVKLGKGLMKGGGSSVIKKPRVR